MIKPTYCVKNKSAGPMHDNTMNTFVDVISDVASNVN